MKHNFKPQTSNFKLLLITIIILIKSVVQTISAQVHPVKSDSLFNRAIINNQSTIINKKDSLFTLLKTAKADTTLVNTYNELSWEYNRSNPDTALYFGNVALKLAIKANYKKGISASYGNIGVIYMYKGDYDKAIDFYFKSLKIREELGDKNGMAGSYICIGEIHRYKGDYDKAIDFYFKSLKIFEESGDKNGMSDSYNSIGIIHAYKGAYDKAIDFFFKSLKIFEELGDKNKMSSSYNNIGIIHMYKGDYDKAIDFYFKSLKIREELGDKNGMSTSYNNIGNIHHEKGDYDKAIDFYFKSLKIREELGDKSGMSASYTNIGNLYLMQNKPKEAKKQQLLALNIALEIGAKDLMYSAYNSLAQCDSALGNFRGAYEYHKLYSQVHDSVFSKESSDKIAEMGAKYEAEKRELTIQKLEKEKLLQDETLARKEAESKKQRILLFSFLAGFIIILVFSVFLYRLFVQKKMANVILAQQKEEISAQRDEIETQRDLVTHQKEHIEEIHKEVTDSINYAKRIQEAMLPQLSSKSQDLSPKLQEEESPKLQEESPKLQDLKSEKLQSSEMFIEKETNPNPELQSSEMFIEKETNPNPELRSSEIFIEKESDSNPELQSSEMFIEKEPNNNIVATTNVHQSDNVPCDKVKPQNLEFETLNLEFETFILFRPKDVVSGDFYWFSQVNDYQIYAVADCTGHGVPGAFMSMLGISFLNEIVRKKEVTQASHVLDQLRVSVIDALRQTGGSGTQKDGMDMSLVVIKNQDSSPKSQIPSTKLQESEKVRQGESEQSSIIGSQFATSTSNFKHQTSNPLQEKESNPNSVATTNENQGDSSPCDNKQTSNLKPQTSNIFHAQWAGANNPLWLVRCSKNLQGFQNLGGLGDDASANDKLQTTNLKLFEFKPDKMPIAIYERMENFTNHEIELSKGDTIYLMSDGYEDQFGGPKYKKFMSKNLKELIIANCQLTMAEQKDILEHSFDNWKGEHEQIDDVTLLGIRI